MPFTPSHALVALPFIRTPLIPAAIAIGAMTPDLPLFVRRIGIDYSFTHGFSNVLWTAALALFLFVLWRVLLRPAVPELMPALIANRLPRNWQSGAVPAAREAIGIGQGRGYPFLLVVSLILGVLSHIIWDLFTHAGRAGVILLPVLDHMWGPLPGYKWLQHGSSVIGLAIIGIWGLLWLRRTPVAESVQRIIPAWLRIAWWVSLPVLLVSAWVIGYLVFGPWTKWFTVQHLAYWVLPPTVTIWGMITLVMCVGILMARRKRGRGVKTVPDLDRSTAEQVDDTPGM